MGHRLLPLLAAFLFLGLLAPAPTTTGAQDAPVYLALGDSLAFGVGASNPSATGYVARVYETLKKSERYQATGLELVNLSVPGACPLLSAWPNDCTSQRLRCSVCWPMASYPLLSPRQP